VPKLSSTNNLQRTGNLLLMCYICQINPISNINEHLEAGASEKEKMKLLKEALDSVDQYVKDKSACKTGEFIVSLLKEEQYTLSRKY